MLKKEIIDRAIFDARRKPREDVVKCAEYAWEDFIKQYTDDGRFTAAHDVFSISLSVGDNIVGRPIPLKPYRLRYVRTLPNITGWNPSTNPMGLTIYDLFIVGNTAKLYQVSTSGWVEITNFTNYLEVVPDTWVCDLGGVISITKYEDGRKIVLEPYTITQFVRSNRDDIYTIVNVGEGLYNIKCVKSANGDMVYSKKLDDSEMNHLQIGYAESVLLIKSIAYAIAEGEATRIKLKEELDEIRKVKAADKVDFVVPKWRY